MVVAAKTFKLLDELKKSPGRPTANPNKQLHHVSPSQISTFRDCPRKWYVETVFGVKQPETESQRLGTEVHLVLEQLVHGESPQGSPRAVEIALAGQNLLPPQGTPCVTEEEFILRDPAVPLPLYGFKDLKTPQYVADHKTTSSISKYAKSEYQWQTDPQAVIYSAHELSIGQHKDFRVNYYQTRGRRQSEYVQIRMSEDAIRFGLQVIGQDVARMVEYAVLPEAEVPYGPQGDNSTDSCDKYGGCHLKMRCMSNGVVPESMGAFQDVASALASSRPPERSSDMSQVLTAKERMARARALATQVAQSEEGAQGINPPQLPGDLPLDQAPDAVIDDVPEEAAPPPPPQPKAVVPDLPPPPPPPRASKAARARAAEAAPAAAATPAEPAIEALAPTAVPTAPAPLNIPVDLEKLKKTADDMAGALVNVQDALKEQERKALKYRKMLLEGDEDAQELLDKVEARIGEMQHICTQHQRLAEETARAYETGLKAEADREQAEKAAAERKSQEAKRNIEPPAQKVHVPTARAPETNELGEMDRPRRVLYLGCCPSVEKNVTFFDAWVQPYLQRAAEARQVPFYRMIAHGAIDAVIAEIIADLRSGKSAPPQHLVFREFAAQHYPYVQDLRPFYDEVIG